MCAGCCCRRLFEAQNRKMDIAKEVVRKRKPAAQAGKETEAAAEQASDDGEEPEEQENVL